MTSGNCQSACVLVCVIYIVWYVTRFWWTQCSQKEIQPRIKVSRNVSFGHDIKVSDCCMYHIFCFEGTNCMYILHIYSFCGLQLSKFFLPLLMFRFKADLAFQRSHSLCIKQLVPRKWILFPPLVVVDGCWYIINYNYPHRTSLLID